MLNKTIVDYVKTSREAGVREFFIRQALLEAGWDRIQIDEALDSEEAWPLKARVDFTEKTKQIISGGKKSGRNSFRQSNLFVKLAIGVGVIILIGAGLWGILRYYNPSYQIVIPVNNSGEISSFQFGSWSALEDASFFKKVKADLLDKKSSFIESDLSNMKLRVYKDGEEKLEVDIISKGHEGSWWETPAGLYQVQSREADHFSSFGRVHMPWSMAFQGNFFIHGWPYYPDGKPVPLGYSGGCIRLSTSDAKQVYDLAEVGMPVLIFEDDFDNDGFEYNFVGGHLDAKSFLAADLKNSYVFAEGNSTEKLPVASLTKLMTALIATEYINIEREVVVDANSLVDTSIPRLKAGQRLTVLDLLYPLLMESSNEAGAVIGKILGEQRFVNLMNEKAKAIGMNNSYFADTTGASHDNVSTAQDLFQLAKYLYNNRSFILAISKGSVGKSAYNPPPWNDLKNLNVFAEDEDFVGGKVGENSAAGQTILSIFEIEKTGSQRPVVIIALNTRDRAKSASDLLSYIRN